MNFVIKYLITIFGTFIYTLSIVLVTSLFVVSENGSELQHICLFWLILMPIFFGLLIAKEIKE